MTKDKLTGKIRNIFDMTGVQIEMIVLLSQKTLDYAVILTFL